MNKPPRGTSDKRSEQFSSWMLPLVIGLMVVGCSHITKRAQSPDTESSEFQEARENVKYVGDISGPRGLEKLKVEGIALVTQLNGTGSDPQPSSQRDFLIEEIQTHNVDSIAQLLSKTSNSMVAVSGVIPPGAKKGDRFDVRVQCYPKSKTTSLDGGYMMQTRMKPMMVSRRSVHMGHNSALSRGRVLVNSLFESQNDQVSQISGRVLGGGIVTKERTAGLRIVDQSRSIQNTTSIARAINDRFTTRQHGSPKGVAQPKSDREVIVEVPDEYQHNIGRYFHVILNIAFGESAEELVNRLEWLERDLHNPSQTSLAAIRLEAIGQEAKPILVRGMQSDDELVRFHASQALAYMGEPSAVAVLRDAAEMEPAFRWHAFKALASINESSSEQVLISLFDSESAETRYGAYQTIRDSMPSSTMINSQNLSREFFLDTVPSKARPLVHISKSRLPEIVLFGFDQRFNGNLLYLESGLTIKALNNSEVQIQRYLPKDGERKLICSTRVEDVIRNVVKVGGDYGNVIRMLKDAKRSDALDSQLVVNAVPQLKNSYRGRTGQSFGYQLPVQADDETGADAQTIPPSTNANSETE